MSSSTSNTVDNEIAKLSFEESIALLEKIVNKIESGKMNLEDAVIYYEKAEKLRYHCEEKLNSVKSKIEKITIKENSTSGTSDKSTSTIVEESDLSEFYE